jgi:beta-N-acetylhexosaminidase
MLRTLVAAGLALACAPILDAFLPVGVAAAEPPAASSGEAEGTAAQGDGSSAGALSSLQKSAQAGDALDRMIGQMILVGFLGDSEKDAGVIAVRDQLARGIVGGVLLFPDNIRSPTQLRSLTAFLAAANPELTPFIAVDQEGGLVQRLTRRNGHVYFPSARDVARNPKLNTPEGAFVLYKKMADGLAKSGINLNFGPVVDLNVNPGNTVIGRRKRSYGSDPKIVSTLAGAFIAAHHEANIVTSAKHFPGHGSSWTDSHKSLPDISRSWRETELEPYVSLSKAGLLDMVMIGHLYHPRFSDGEKMPASLSGRAVHALRAQRRHGDGRDKGPLPLRRRHRQGRQCRHRHSGFLQCEVSRSEAWREGACGDH